MNTVFQRVLFRSRGAILGWGLTLALLGMLFIPFYDTIAENADQFEQLMDIYPEEIMGFFGESGMMNFTTPEGFLSIEYFSYMPLVVGVFAILAGSGMLGADEDRGVLDLIAAQPVSRPGLFGGLLFSLLVSLIIIVAMGYAGIMASTTYSVMELDAAQVLVPFTSMFALLVFFAGFSLLLSMLLPSRQSAAMVAGLRLGGGFFINGLFPFDRPLGRMNRLPPFTYFQS